jgi:hypothetical protein
MLGEVLSADMPLPRTDKPWRAVLEEAGRAYRRALLAHRDAARILAATPPTGPNRLRGVEAMLATLRRAGFSLQDVADAGYVMNSFVTGYVIDEVLGAQAAPPDSSPPATAGDGITLGAITQGHLVVQRGATNLAIRAASPMTGLYHVASDGREPQIEAVEGTVTLKQRHGTHLATLVLNGAIPWAVNIRGGASRLAVDFVQGCLTSLHLGGGLSQGTIRLPLPIGEVPFTIAGGVSKLVVERPAGSAIRVHLSHGSSRLTLDAMQLGSVGGEVRWDSQGFAAASGFYDLEINGGASELTVRPAADQTSAGPQAPTEAPAWDVQRLFGPNFQDYPTLAAVMQQLISPDADHRFEFGLQVLLDGLERRLARHVEQA